jgi:hypothetical protein
MRVDSVSFAGRLSNMDYEVKLLIWNANSKEEAEQAVNEMLDAYDLHNFTDVQINWPINGEVVPHP